MLSRTHVASFVAQSKPIHSSTRDPSSSTFDCRNSAKRFRKSSLPNGSASPIGARKSVSKMESTQMLCTAFALSFDLPTAFRHVSLT